MNPINRIMPTFQKIFLILNKQGNAQIERLSQTLLGLFSYVNLTSSLYIVVEDLPESMPQVERIQKEVSEFLRKSLFVRLYVHFVHPAPEAAMEEIRLCYQYLKQATREFDQEGYRHQEVPRLMLLPVIIPDEKSGPTSLINLFDSLKRSFLLPSLYISRPTLSLAQDEGLLSRTEKVYYGHGNTKELPEIVYNLCYQDILDDSCIMLEDESVSMTKPCPAALILSTQENKAYACMDAFRKKEGLADLFGEVSLDDMMTRYDDQRRSKRGCLACREQVAESFAGLSLPKETRHEVGALLYHFGALHQEGEGHNRAIENYKKSLELSPVEEAGSIYFRLGLSYTKTGHYDQALEAFNRAGHTYHDQYYFHFYKGLCYFEKGDYRKAIEKFSKALHLKPQHEDLVRILIYIGTCYNSLGEYEKGLVELERAKKGAGHVKEIYSILGFSHYQLKEYDKAIQNLSRAIEIDPYSAIDYASLGSNYREKGDTRKAIAMYEKALALDPDMTAARENLERLKEKP